MPQKIVCEGCGKVLFKDYKLKTPEEIIHLFNNKCPNCGKNLEFNPKKVEINILEK